MNLNYLKQFLELVEHASLNQYATHKNVTHAQVSRMVMELEKEFGYKLLIRDRTRSDIKLTDKGEILVKRIPIIFAEIDYMHSILSYDEQEVSGIFNLQTSTHLIDYWIAPYLGQLKQDNPHIILNLLGREQVSSAEEKKRLLTISPLTENSSDYIQIPLKEFHTGLWASETYIKVHGQPKTTADLKNHTLICFENSISDAVYSSVNWHIHTIDDIKPENIVVIQSNAGIVRAAQAGLGIFSFTEESMKAMNINFERILPDFTIPTVPMGLSYPTDWQNLKSIKIIQEFLLEIFNDEKFLPEVVTD